MLLAHHATCPVSTNGGRKMDGTPKNPVVLVKVYLLRGDDDPPLCGMARLDYHELMEWHWSHKSRPECEFITSDSFDSCLEWSGEFCVGVIQDMVQSVNHTPPKKKKGN